MSQDSFSHEIDQGLSSIPKSISSKYFYDDLGSQIFQEITGLKEYYVTRAELSILESLKNILPDMIETFEIDIIELGVGDGHKTKIMIESFLNKNIKVNFYPIDISREALHLLEKNISQNSKLTVNAIVAEYIEGLTILRNKTEHVQLVLFLGSNIGNFTPKERLELLQKIRANLKPNDYLLVGFDLKKDINILTHAYSDDEGLTAKFNLNVLSRINAELGADFSLEHFLHYALYNPVIGAMESFLLADKEQTVHIKALNKSFHFEAFEPIHLEYSYKFLEKDIDELCLKSGFTHLTNFSDANHFFIDSLWQVQTP